MRRLWAILPLVSATTLFVAIFLVSQHPSRLPYAVAAIGAAAVITSGALSFLSAARHSAIAPAVLPALLAGSVSLAVFFIESNALRIGLAAAMAVLFYVLVRHLAESTRIEGASAALRALSEWSALIIVVGLSSALMAAATFLNWNQWLAALIFAAVGVFIVFTLSRLSRVKGWLLPAVASVLLVQGFVLLLFLPVSHWVSGGVLAAMAYLLFSLISNVPVVSVRRALISAGAICSLLLLTARWR